MFQNFARAQYECLQSAYKASSQAIANRPCSPIKAPFSASVPHLLFIPLRKVSKLTFNSRLCPIDFHPTLCFSNLPYCCADILLSTSILKFGVTVPGVLGHSRGAVAVPFVSDPQSSDLEQDEECRCSARWGGCWLVRCSSCRSAQGRILRCR